MASFRSNRTLHLLIAVFSCAWIASAIKPEIPEDWLLENLLVFTLIALLVGTYRWFVFSNASYAMLTILLCLHECGAHYQYSAALPGEWLKATLHGERNQYDRIVHFAFGLFCWYPQREFLARCAGLAGSIALATLPLLTTLALSAAYEIVESIVASVADPNDALAFLGSQGDPWDAQKDMAIALGGSLLACAIWFLKPRSVASSSPSTG